jgi:THO complex subunit 5
MHLANLPPIVVALLALWLTALHRLLFGVPSRHHRSRHHDLDLAAPEEALNADAITGVLDDPHQLMLARLEAERKERQRLLTEHLRLRHVKVDAEQAFDAKRDQLQKLPQLLQEVLAAANPMIDFFEIAESDEGASAHGDSAAYLPTPLYVLYSCLADFRTLSKDAYTVKVTGDLKAAKDPAVLKLWEGDANVSADSAMQLESEAQELARRYGTDETESIEQQAKAAKRRLLRKHPLSIDLELVDGPKLQFGYLLELRVVTVSIADVADDAALQYMYPNDVGTELPTEASAHKMEESGLNPYAEYAAKLGRPYKWAQLISGCPVDGEAAGPTVESRLRRRNMTRVVPDIIAHAKAARSLAAQLERLSALDVSVGPGLGVEVERVLFPLPTSTSLSSWAQASDEAELSTYAAMLTRGDTTLRLTVAVSKMYPMVPPKFTIVIDDEGKSVADDDVSRVDPNVEAMEREVNVHFDELIEKVEPSLLLMLQMRRLQMCVDIFSEYAAIEAGKKQTVSKLFERASGGQDRLRPFVFDHTQGVFVHRKKL